MCGEEAALLPRSYLGEPLGGVVPVVPDLRRDGVPVRVSDVATVQLGPDFRRGALDYNGAEAVGGVVVMRYG